jgi:hypothetical protein
VVGVEAITQPGNPSCDLVELNALLASIWEAVSSRAGLWEGDTDRVSTRTSWRVDGMNLMLIEGKKKRRTGNRWMQAQE